jgi:general secretion pathway protein G
MRNRTKRGFTLVEILIVVVILGILAAIVIPQFSQASTDSKVSSLQSNLQTIRSQIALYKIQHNDTTPCTIAGAYAFDEDVFTDQMTGFTGLDGTCYATKALAEAGSSDGKAYGPYLQVGVPANPFVGGNPATLLGANGAANAADWVYISDGSTWDFHANPDSTAQSALHIAY